MLVLNEYSFIQQPLEQIAERGLAVNHRKLACMLYSVDAVSQTEVLGPEVKQVLLNAVVPVFKAREGIGVHDIKGELEGLLQADKLLFQPHQGLEAVCLFVLLRRIFITLSSYLHKQRDDLLFLVERNWGYLAALLVADEFLELQQALLEVVFNFVDYFQISRSSLWLIAVHMACELASALKVRAISSSWFL